MEASKQIESKLLSVEDAAAYLGVAAYTLRGKLRKGEWKIPEVRMGGLIKFDQEDLDAFIASIKKVRGAE
jgi:excisionase family DNA binding protein